VDIVSATAQQCRRVPWQVFVQLEAVRHPPRLGGDGYDPLPRQIGGVSQGGCDVLGRERGVLVENALCSFAGGEVIENDRNRNSSSLEAHGAVHDGGVGGDEVFQVHARLRSAAAGRLWGA